MGVDTKKLRNRIKSVDSTLHLTTAMGLVASSKIRKAMEAMLKSREYAGMIEKVVQNLANSKECAKSPYMEQRGEGKTCIIVIAGDRGLAGGYNSNVFRLAKQYPDAEFIAVGKRACDIFGGEYNAEYFSFEQASALSKKLCSEFSEGSIDRVGIISTEYISMMSQEARISWILPLVRSEETDDMTGIIFEPDELSVLNTAVPLYVAGMIVAHVRESFISEVAARRCAMDSAGKNAKQMIDDLQLAYNRARQSAITQEITEIVAGSGM
ncbi:MAG: ATP synthase F1 subunit gamma [Ruminococcus sp.]|nr:ATP synthase F1 subunit gamma [Ruminococcus sp.]